MRIDEEISFCKTNFGVSGRSFGTPSFGTSMIGNSQGKSPFSFDCYLSWMSRNSLYSLGLKGWDLHRHRSVLWFLVGAAYHAPHGQREPGRKPAFSCFWNCPATCQSLASKFELLGILAELTVLPWSSPFHSHPGMSIAQKDSQQISEGTRNQSAVCSRAWWTRPNPARSIGPRISSNIPDGSLRPDRHFSRSNSACVLLEAVQRRDRAPGN